MVAPSAPRPRLVVLDANTFWTEQLFRHCRGFADVLLLKPRDFRAHRAAAGTWFSDRRACALEPGVFEQRLSMGPGWMFRFWPLAQRKLARAIRAWAASQSAGPLTLVLTYPQYRRLIPALKPTRSVYYNLDDYRDNWPAHGADVPRWEAELVELADLTVCIADYRANLLRRNHLTRAARIHHLPLGCTPEFMASNADEPNPPRPPKLSSLHGPVVGHIGALNRRFDYAFLAEVAVRLPGINFVLGGRVQEDGDDAWATGLRRARQTTNIHFIGWVAHDELGNYLKSFDALFMCYSACDFNLNACPAKLWDYFGTGKPIVANDNNPETLLWRDAIGIGATPEEFAAAVREALSEVGDVSRERRLTIAREHTWESLSNRLARILTGGDKRQLTETVWRL